MKGSEKLKNVIPRTDGFKDLRSQQVGTIIYKAIGDVKERGTIGPAVKVSEKWGS